MGAGVQFCLSQFDPGPDADALLGQLPLSYVRMAGRFAGAHADAQLRDQLRSTIDQAHRLGLQVIGQQIEDPQAAAAMWMGGIDYIQATWCTRSAPSSTSTSRTRCCDAGTGTGAAPCLARARGDGRRMHAAGNRPRAERECLGIMGDRVGGLALATLVFTLGAVVSSGAWARDLNEANARAAAAEDECTLLQRDVNRHDQLEQQLLQAKRAAESAVLSQGRIPYHDEP